MLSKAELGLERETELEKVGALARLLTAWCVGFCRL